MCPDYTYTYIQTVYEKNIASFVTAYAYCYLYACMCVLLCQLYNGNVLAFAVCAWLPTGTL